MNPRPFAETPLQRLQNTAEWSTTSERREVEIRKEDLQWAVERLAYLQMILGRDLDLDEPLPDIAADLSQEEAPL